MRKLLIFAPELWAERIEIVVPVAIFTTAFFSVWCGVQPIGLLMPRSPELIFDSQVIALSALIAVWCLSPSRVSMTERFGERRPILEGLCGLLILLSVALACSGPFIAGSILAARMRAFQPIHDVVRDANDFQRGAAYWVSGLGTSRLEVNPAYSEVILGDADALSLAINKRSNRSAKDADLASFKRVNEKYGGSLQAEPWADLLKEASTGTNIVGRLPPETEVARRSLLIYLEAHGVLEGAPHTSDANRAMALFWVLCLASLRYVWRHNAPFLFRVIIALSLLSTFVFRLVDAVFLQKAYGVFSQFGFRFQFLQLTSFMVAIVWIIWRRSRLIYFYALTVGLYFAVVVGTADEIVRQVVSFWTVFRNGIPWVEDFILRGNSSFLPQAIYWISIGQSLLALSLRRHIIKIEAAPR